jgi:hypothetical protein
MVLFICTYFVLCSVHSKCTRLCTGNMSVEKRNMNASESYTGSTLKAGGGGEQGDRNMTGQLEITHW